MVLLPFVLVGEVPAGVKDVVVGAGVVVIGACENDGLQLSVAN
jgi:hypothetical protein